MSSKISEYSAFNMICDCEAPLSKPHFKMFCDGNLSLEGVNCLYCGKIDVETFRELIYLVEKYVSEEEQGE